MASNGSDANYLNAFRDEFYDNFTFQFVRPEMEAVFNPDQMIAIQNERTSKKQIDTMFHILNSGEARMHEFINALSLKYDWLYEKLNARLLSPEFRQAANDHSIIEGVRKNFRREIPKFEDHYIERPEFCERIIKQLIFLEKNQCLIITGNIGYGKRWLAIAACFNEEVIRRMGHKIIPLNVSKCTTLETVYEKLIKLKILLRIENVDTSVNNETSIKHKLLRLQLQLTDTFNSREYSECLLVLYNVQNVEMLKHFHLDCKLMVTTRNKDIYNKMPSKATRCISVDDGFTLGQTIDYFCKILRIDSTTHNASLRSIFELSQGSPFIASIIAKDFREHKGSTDKRMAAWIKNLKAYNINTFCMQALIDPTLDEFTTKERDLFYSLVIFSDNVYIPLNVLAQYWKMPFEEVEQIIIKFENHSLIEIFEFPDEDVSFSYHFLIFSYLKRKVTNTVEAHRKFVESYRIDEALKNRRQPVIFNLRNDKYFYHFIDYHLSAAKMTEYFPLLYLDFGFIEEKLRVSGLANTIGDLNEYNDEICAGSEYRQQLLDEMLHFLPYIEEMLLKSEDTCLLQYAINSEGELSGEAMRQIEKFPNRVWFWNEDRLYKRRQIIKLPGVANLIKFFYKDRALITLNDNSIQLIDLSSDYSRKSYTFKGHMSKIIDIQFLSRDYFLTLDVAGSCQVWVNRDSLLDRGSEIRLSNRQRRKSDRNDSFETSVYEFAKMYIKCFHLVDEITLFAATIEGEILRFKRVDKKYEYENMLHEHIITRLNDIRAIRYISNHKVLVVLDSAEVYLYNLKDHSRKSINVKCRRPMTYINIHQEEDSDCTYVFLIYSQCVVKLMIPYSWDEPTIEKELYSVEIGQNTITCSTISDNSRIIILGTHIGIVVCDTNDKMEIMRRAVSEVVTCIDVYSLDDVTYKYVMMCGTESSEGLLNLYGVKIEDAIGRVSSMSDKMGSLSLNGRQSPSGALKDTIFDVCGDPNGSESTILYALDSKNRIHRKLSSNNFLTSDMCGNLNQKIVALAAFDDRVIIGCENGAVLKKEENGSTTLLFTVGVMINKIDIFENDTLVITTDNCVIVRTKDRISTIDVDAVKVYLYQKNFLLLLQQNCQFKIYNIEAQKIVHNTASTNHYFFADLTASCLAGHFLLFGSFDNRMNRCTFNHHQNANDDTTEFAVLYDHISLQLDAQITSIATSSDLSLFAVGFITGAIKLYEMGTPSKLLKRFVSHKSRIYKLKFCPWLETTTNPIILVSLAEQICFWNVTEALKHTRDLQKKRSGERFVSNRIPKAVYDAQIILNNKSANRLKDDPWAGCIGPPSKPELLSCIKFIGHSAKKLKVNESFTEFLTIDSEGDVYYLKLRERIEVIKTRITT